MDLTKKTITGQDELDNGFEKLTLSDGTVLVGMFTILPAKAAVADAPAKPAAKKAEPETMDVPEDWDELDELDEDELTALIEQEELDTDVDDYEDDLVGLKKAIAKELEIEIPKAKGKKEEKAPAKTPAKKAPEPAEEEDEDLEWEDLADMDEDQLTDLIDEEDLKVDADDYEDDLDGLRRAIAKELDIEAPAKKKKK